jgi:chromate reductase, NAD(P)H dehydrogenase (quinone)
MILGISGSLRTGSANGIILDTLSALIGERGQFRLYAGLADLPHFTPDRADDPAVTDLRQQLAEANAVVICTPEYAFGIPGSLKNGLDWTVGTGEFGGKPVALITASTSGERGHAALKLVLSALDADLRAELLIPHVNAKIRDGRVVDTDTLTALRDIADALTLT